MRAVREFIAQALPQVGGRVRPQLVRGDQLPAVYYSPAPDELRTLNGDVPRAILAEVTLLGRSYDEVQDMIDAMLAADGTTTTVGQRRYQWTIEDVGAPVVVVEQQDGTYVWGASVGIRAEIDVRR